MKLKGRTTRLWWRIGLSILVILLVAGAVVAFLSNQSTNSPSAKPEQKTQAAPAKPISVKTSALFMGDVFWGRYINDWSMASSLKTTYPFSRLNEFNKDSYNAWIANLECPTVAGFTQTSAEEDTTLSFNCSPDYLPEAAKWFNIVSLANNHTDNRGAVGFTETKQQLNKNGIQYFGHYEPAVTEDACEVVALPVTVTYDDKSTKGQKLPIALCGYNGVFKIPPANSIAEITKYSELMPVIVMPHMGAEYKATPDAIRTTTYRAMIDAGADVVIGNHPHWVQSTEAYKGKLIVYSMGNFIFDQQANKEVTRSAMINVVMNTTNAKNDQLASWLELGETCATFKDTCLAMAQAGNLTKLPMEIKYGVVGSSSANKQTKPATEAETAEILTRLNWTQTMGQLQSPQGSL